MQLMFGKQIFFALGAIARLNVADQLSNEPADVETVAAATGTHAPSLYRVLRMLAGVGVFNELPGHRFTITPIGELLQTHSPRSMRDMAIMFTDPWQIAAQQKMLDSIRTGVDGVTLAFGKQAFDLFRDIPDQAANFHRAMSSFSRGAAEGILQVADFSGFRRMADVGGGHGALLGGILKRWSSLQGILFDLPEVVSGALDTGHFAGCEHRIQFESGNFFERIPKECDAYLMKHILHDWDDGSCRRILSLMREQLAKTAFRAGRVFLFEMVVPDGPGPAPAKLLDIEMLTNTRGGKERTESEFATLLASAGLKLTRIIPTHGPVCIVEAAVE